MALFDAVEQHVYIQRTRADQMRGASPEQCEVYEASAKKADDIGARFCGGVMIVAAPFIGILNPVAGVGLVVKGAQTLFSKEPQKTLNQSALSLATDAAKAEVSTPPSNDNPKK